MSAVADRIMKRVRGKGRGWVFTPKNFVDFGTRGSVDMALSRLASAGDIRRIGRGLYDLRQKGRKALKDYPDLAAYYRERLDSLPAPDGDVDGTKR